MILETNRLILRPWEIQDASDLFEFAKDPRIGPIAGWPPHKNIEESIKIIRDVLSMPETYAVVLKEEKRSVGSIGLKIGEKSDFDISPNEAEIGYWIGFPYWGRGLIPEATKEIVRHGFEDLKLNCMWCGHYDGNQKSRRVQEKCGFIYHHTTQNANVPLMNEVRIRHVAFLSKERWESNFKKC